MAIHITPVENKSDLEAFIRYPFKLYADQPRWVPPLIFERRQFLNRSKNPFFEHGEAQYFLARRDGQIVGRISAQIDENFNQFQSNNWGLFGFFDSEDDREVAQLLLDTAANWLSQKGRDRIVGPMDFTMNDEAGFLVEGFERAPTILTNWTMPYYPALLESAGYAKAMDLFMWELYISAFESVHPAIKQAAEEVESKHQITVRPMRKRDMQNEVERFLDVYNTAWATNNDEPRWGFVPLTDSEVRHYAKLLKPLLDENWAWIAEKDGETVGAALTLPDYNQVLSHLNGHILPLGWLKFLRYRRRINQVRVFALGVKPQYQHTGIAAKFYVEHFHSAARTPQSGGEMGWILETNEPMNRAMEGMGAKIVRRYRLFEKQLDQS